MAWVGKVGWRQMHFSFRVIPCLKIVCFKYKEGRNLMKIDGLY